MIKKVLNNYIFEAIGILTVVVIALISYLVINSTKVANKYVEKNYEYVSYEILTDNVLPVISTTNDNENTILRPYNEPDVTIGKSYYDYTSTDSKDQENSLIYYENTYIQNTGVDYVKETPFKIIAILDGTVLSVTEDDIVGKTVKIQHDNGMISVYQSLSETTVEQNDKVSRGQEIGTSGENTISSDLKNHLHFELYYNNKLVNPEKYLEKSLGEF